MRKIFSISLTLFVCMFLALSTSQAQDQPFELDPELNPALADTIPDPTFPAAVKWTFDYSVLANPMTATVGGIYFQGKFYLNKWTSSFGGHQCYTFLPDGNGAPDPTTQDSTGSPPYIGAIRDMTIAPDGGGVPHLYGGPASSTLYKMDAGMNVISTFTIPGADFRAIAYDPITGGFWNGDFSGTVTCYDTLGNQVGTSPNGSALTGKYGAAYDYGVVFGGTPAVWWWSQQGTGLPNDLVAIDPTNDAILGSWVMDQTGVGISGGAEVCQIMGEWILVLNYQNVALQGFFLGIVPVELTSFAASVNEGIVTLNWQTATEVNNSGFEVERKAGNGEFAAIGFVEGVGTTTEVQNYSYTDKSVQPGSYTYRLKQVDFDGTSEYSDEVAVDITAPSTFTLAQNYPNPFNPSTKIDFSLAVDSKVNLTVFNLLGEKVATIVNTNYAAGNHSVDFNASALNSGVYFYKIDATGIDGTEFSNVKKMMLTK